MFSLLACNIRYRTSIVIAWVSLSVGRWKTNYWNWYFEKIILSFRSLWAKKQLGEKKKNQWNLLRFNWENIGNDVERQQMRKIGDKKSNYSDETFVDSGGEAILRTSSSIVDDSKEPKIDENTSQVTQILSCQNDTSYTTVPLSWPNLIVTLAGGKYRFVFFFFFSSHNFSHPLPPPPTPGRVWSMNIAST